MKKYTIQTARLGLRNWKMSDLKQMTELNQDKEVMEFFLSTNDEKETKDFIIRMQQHFEDKGFCYFAADRLDTGDFIGFIGLMSQNFLDDIPAFVDIGWRLKKAAWGKGFATEGAKACLKFAFEKLNLDAVYSVASEINVKSIHVMKKIEMEKIRVFDHPKLLNDKRLKSCALYRVLDKKDMNNLQKRDAQYCWHPYTQHATSKAPLPIVKGKDALLFDEDGNEYIDAVASWWTNTLGHSHPYIAKKVYEQMQQLEHVIFAGFTHKPAVDLAERLLKHLPNNQAKIFYSDNGSTAVEIGIKMALQYFDNKGIKRKKLVAFEGAFHGETFGAMSASADLGLNNAFEEHLFDVLRIPVPFEGQEEKSKEALKEILEKEDVYAFLFEPLIQGTSGMRMYAPEPLDELISICKKNNVLTIADEVMVGFYRTGRFFATDYLVNKPDIVSMGKGLTAGSLPLAVTSCTQDVFDAFLSDDKMKTLFHGHSFTANPVGCAAALASLDIIGNPYFQEEIDRIMGKHAAFKKKIEKSEKIIQVRHLGTIIAFEFKTNEQSSYFNNLRDKLYYFFLENGVLLRPLGNVIYILPPYCITDAQLDKVYGLIERALEEVV